MDVDQIRNGVKGDEGNAKREEAHRLQAEDAEAEQPLYTRDEEVEVLERAEQTEICANSEGRGCGSRRALRSVDRNRHGVIHHQDDQQNEYEPGFPPRVEHQRSEQQKDVLRRDAREEVVDRQEYRQKIKQ